MEASFFSFFDFFIFLFFFFANVEGVQLRRLKDRIWNPRQVCGGRALKRKKKRGYVDQDKKKVRIGSHSTKSFKILGYIFNPAGEMQESLAGRMQSASKAWWRDAKIQESKNVACRLVWNRSILDRINGWETKVMRFVQIHEIDRENMERILHEDSEDGKNNLEEDEPTIWLPPRRATRKKSPKNFPIFHSNS